MESLNYSNLGNKINRRSDGIQKGQHPSLKEIYNHLKAEEVPYIEEKTLDAAYASEIESLLKKTTIEETIKDLYSLENNLNKLKSIVPVGVRTPFLGKFWKELSPTLLLSLWESLENDEPSEEIVKGWLESIRISLESELYHIQEKWL